jgi:deoxyribonuclease-2
MSALYLYLAALLVSYVSARNPFSCQNHLGQPVDWYVMYKIPHLGTSTIPLVADGVALLYMDQFTNGQWLQLNVSVNDTNQPFGYTLQQLYDYETQPDVFHMMYNDEWPDGQTTSDYGHCKGVLTFDYVSGFWLIHSVPKFPTDISYSYPSSGTKYGQTALCVTLSYAALNDIGNQLMYYEPWIYSSAIPLNMSEQNPLIQNVLDKKYITSAPYNNEFSFRSLGGVKFMNFAKHKKWGKDIYFDFVAPTLDQALYTETWQDGSGDLPSNCSDSFPVYNIKYVNLTSTINFSDGDDHSKWAVSPYGGQYVCIGDVNRQSGQFKRGGGTMCFDDPLVWNTFNNSVQSIQPCTTTAAKM